MAAYDNYVDEVWNCENSLRGNCPWAEMEKRGEELGKRDLPPDITPEEIAAYDQFKEYQGIVTERAAITRRQLHQQAKRAEAGARFMNALAEQQLAQSRAICLECRRYPAYCDPFDAVWHCNNAGLGDDGSGADAGRRNQAQQRRAERTREVEKTTKPTPTNGEPPSAVEVDYARGSADGVAYLRIGSARLKLGRFSEECLSCGFIDIGTVSVRRLSHPNASPSFLLIKWQTSPGGNGGVVSSGFILTSEDTPARILGRGQFITASGDEGFQTPARGGGAEVEMSSRAVLVTVRQTYVNSGWFDEQVPRIAERDTIAESTIRCSYSLDGRLTKGPVDYRIVDEELARAFSLSPQPDQFIRRRLEEACATAG